MLRRTENLPWHPFAQYLVAVSAWPLLFDHPNCSEARVKNWHHSGGQEHSEVTKPLLLSEDCGLALAQMKA